MNLEEKQAEMRERNSAPAKETTQEWYTVKQVAEKLQFTTEWVIQMFVNEPGVLVAGNKVTTRDKRRRRVLRIPVHVFNRVLNRLTNK
jgi:hypothetical protein